MAQPGIQSVERSFIVLEHLARCSQGAQLAELSAAVGMPKTTVHRLLQNLAAMGYVGRHEATGSYRATLRMFEVGSEVVAHIDTVSVARPYLDKLAALCSETVHLVVPDGADIVYVYKAESGSMRMSSRLGLRIPMYCTGVGKAIMSSLPYAAARRIWQQSAPHAKLTPATITSFEELEPQLAEARRTGWALDDEENELGVRCVATALPGPDGTPLAAFSVSSLSVRMPPQRTQELAALCLQVRQDILRELGLSVLRRG